MRKKCWEKEHHKPLEFEMQCVFEHCYQNLSRHLDLGRFLSCSVLFQLCPVLTPLYASELAWMGESQLLLGTTDNNERH